MYLVDIKDMKRLTEKEMKQERVKDFFWNAGENALGLIGLAAFGTSMLVMVAGLVIFWAGLITAILA
jgi:hypothetical protein